LGGRQAPRAEIVGRASRKDRLEIGRGHGRPRRGDLNSGTYGK